jgi:hypothetical protein
VVMCVKAVTRLLHSKKTIRDVITGNYFFFRKIDGTCGIPHQSAILYLIFDMKDLKNKMSSKSTQLMKRSLLNGKSGSGRSQNIF